MEATGRAGFGRVQVAGRRPRRARVGHTRRGADVAALPPGALRVVHRPSADTTDVDRNLVILLSAKRRADAVGEPLDSRLLFSLGLELTDWGRFEEALETLESYVGRDEGEWTDERAHAASRCGACLRTLGRLDQAIELEEEAVRARPDWNELALGLAELDGLVRRWQQEAQWASRARRSSRCRRRPSGSDPAGSCWGRSFA